jgi:hypothetical protein
MNVRRVLAGIRHDLHQKVVGRRRVLGGEGWAKSELRQRRDVFLHAAGSWMKAKDSQHQAPGKLQAAKFNAWLTPCFRRVGGNYFITALVAMAGIKLERFH